MPEQKRAEAAESELAANRASSAAADKALRTAFNKETEAMELKLKSAESRAAAAETQAVHSTQELDQLRASVRSLQSELRGAQLDRDQLGTDLRLKAQ